MPPRSPENSPLSTSKQEEIPTSVILDYESVPQITVSESESWDDASLVDLLFTTIQKAPWYKEGLLYSGFDYTKSEVTFKGGTIYCGKESEFYDLTTNNSPLTHALQSGYTRPAIGVYDPLKMKEQENAFTHKYHMIDSGALVAVILIEK